MTTTKKKAPVRTPPRIEWPTALVLTAVLAALVAVWAFSSPEQRSTMLTGIAALGSVVLAIMRQMLAAQDHDAEPPDSVAPPVRAPNGLDRHEPLNRDDERGRMRVGLPAFARPLAPLLLGLALIASGCGASALHTHARVGIFASVSLQASHGALVSTCTTLRDACMSEPGCLAERRASCEVAAHAQDGARDAVDVYLGAIELAQAAGGDGLGTILGQALTLTRSAYEGLARALAALGVPLPAIPAELLALLGGAS